MLGPDTLLTLSRDIITRNDPAGLLLFQVRTDEIYLISPAAAAVLKLADGSRTVSEVERDGAVLDPHFDVDAARPAMRDLLQKLVDRHVLEVWE